MNFTKTVLALAIGSIGIMGAMSAHATAVNTGDVLSIQAPTFDANGYVVSGSGSFFAMDANGDGLFSAAERIKLSQGTTGLVIGTTTLAGPSHYGNPVDLDPSPGVNIEKGAIDQAWSFLANTGSDFLVSAVTGDTSTGLNFSGWRVTWNGIPSINMGGGAPATFVWDGVYGHTYTVDYLATVPLSDTSGFGGVSYLLHLQGVVAVPEASTYGMMLAGLGLVGLMGCRRSRVCQENYQVE